MDKDRFSDGIMFKWLNQKEIYAKYDNKGRSAKLQAYLDELHEDYIATRPGTDFGNDSQHGLFGYVNEDSNVEKMKLEDIKKYIGKKTLNGVDVYKTVISLSEKDAIQYGFTTKRAWKDLLVDKVQEIAKEFGIDSKDLEWTASYHSKKNNPHCHLLLWNKNQNLQINKKPFVFYKRIRKTLAKSIFKLKLQSLYDIKNISKKQIANMTNEELEKYKSDLKELYKNPDIKIRVTDTEREEKIILDSLKELKIDECIYICDIEEPNNFSEIKKIDNDKFEYKNFGEQSILYREQSYLDTVQFLSNFSDLKIFKNKNELEEYIKFKKNEHIDIENNLKEIMPDIFGIPIISNKFKEQNFEIILNKMIELKNFTNDFENGYKYLYQSPEVKRNIDIISKLILKSSEDCKCEFDEYIKTSINASKLMEEIDSKKSYDRIKKKAENEMFNKIGNQILQFMKSISFEEFIRKREEWINRQLNYEEIKGIQKANMEENIKQEEQNNIRKMITEVFQVLSNENISHNAYFNRIKRNTNLSKQSKKEQYLKNRMKGNIDWGLER